MPAADASKMSTPMMNIEDQTALEQRRQEHRREKRKRRKARRQARRVAEVVTAPDLARMQDRVAVRARGSRDLTSSPSAQLRAQLLSSALQNESDELVAAGKVYPCGIPNTLVQPTELSSTGDAVSAALLRMNSSIGGLIEAFSPPASRRTSACETSSSCSGTPTRLLQSDPVELPFRSFATAEQKPITALVSISDSTKPNVKRPRLSRAKHTPEERERRRNNRRLVEDYGYDMSEDDLNDLFPSCQSRGEGLDDDDDDDDSMFGEGLPSFYSGGSEKFEYTMSFIDGCRL